jgi:hypothetical protein
MENGGRVTKSQKLGRNIAFYQNVKNSPSKTALFCPDISPWTEKMAKFEGLENTFCQRLNPF